MHFGCYMCDTTKFRVYLLTFLRATSHTRLSAHDQYTSSTLIGGESRAGRSLLHTALEGPTKDVDARWM